MTEADIAAAIKELEDIKAHPERYKKYDSFGELMEDLFREGMYDDDDENEL